MNMKNGCLKYTIDNQEKSKEIYTNIPIDKKLYLVVFLKYKDDKVIVSDNNWKVIVAKKELQKKRKNDNEDKKKEDKKEKVINEYSPPRLPLRGRGVQIGRGRRMNFRRIGPIRGFRRFFRGRGRLRGGN